MEGEPVRIQSDATWHGSEAVTAPLDDAVPLQAGDLLRWRDRFAVVDDVASFAAAGTHVTISFLDGRGLPLCVEMGDLSGSEVWRRLGELVDRPVSS